LAWNPNPKFAGHIYVGTRAGIVRFWQPTKDIPYLKDVAQALRDLSDSQDNEASTPQQPQLSQSQIKDYIANAETEAELIPFTCQAFESAEEQVNTIVCSPGGTCVASGGDKGTVQFFTIIGSPAKTQTIGLHDKKVTELVWSHGGDKLLTGADDGTARVLEFVVSQNKWVCSLTGTVPS
jgi:WD40 repeat protein